MADVHFHGGPRWAERRVGDPGTDWIYDDRATIEYWFDRYRADSTVFRHKALQADRVELIQGRRTYCD